MRVASSGIMGPKIFDCPAEGRGIVLEAADALVAVEAEEAANLLRSVRMIDVSGLGGLADSTDATLRSEEPVDPLTRDAVAML
ncbi:MAG TPA: hypothetical protein VEV43_02295 [Actinomycetota bacterium]|nr:hypothetical protein [Actinomycetota bacterium]